MFHNCYLYHFARSAAHTGIDGASIRGCFCVLTLICCQSASIDNPEVLFCPPLNIRRISSMTQIEKHLQIWYAVKTDLSRNWFPLEKPVLDTLCSPDKSLSVCIIERGIPGIRCITDVNISNIKHTLLYITQEINFHAMQGQIQKYFPQRGDNILQT